MTRVYAATRLLEHGPLTWRDLLSITGWTYNELRGVMDRLVTSGVVRKEPAGPHRNRYWLTA
jgi:hypothetical protein